MDQESQYFEVPFKKLIPLVKMEKGCAAFRKEHHNTTIDLQYLDVTSTGTTKDEKKYYADLSVFIKRAVTGGSLICKDVNDWPHKSPKKRDADARHGDHALFLSQTDTGRKIEGLRKDSSFDPTCSKERVEHVARNSYARSIAGGEIKLLRRGFGTTVDEPFLTPGIEAEETRQELCDYANDMQLRQHRQFVFMFYVYRTSARIMRWDRVGCLVSEPIDLNTEPEKLFEFFYRLSRATDVQLGLDPTATMIRKDLGNESHLDALTQALSALNPEARTTPYIKKAFSSEGASWPYYVLQVPEKDDPKKMRSFLVRNFSSHSNSLTGRVTKGYIAFDLETKTFRFLKDSWRPDSLRIHSELEVYGKLEPLQWPYFATVCCGGDLRVPHGKTHRIQRTLTQTFAPDNSWYPWVHNRIVLNEVGIPLKDYTDSHELCAVVFGAFQAHDRAWQAGILHRDISDGNIVIYEDPSTTRIKGLLIDWDICKYRDELTKGSTYKTRAGTWRFLSAALLAYPKKGNEVADDIESFMHLLAIFALRYHNHGQSEAMIKSLMLTAYDFYELRQGYYMGSTTKLLYVSAGIIPFDLRPAGAFSGLLKSLATVCKEHYAHLDPVDMRAKYGIPVDGVASPLRIATPETSKSSAPEGSKSSVPDDIYDYGSEPETVIPAPPPASATLSDHRAFGRAFATALRRGATGWYAEDKGDDLFSKVNWHGSIATTSGSTMPSRKRGRSSAFSGTDSAQDKSRDGEGEAQPPAAKKAKTSAHVTLKSMAGASGQLPTNEEK